MTVFRGQKVLVVEDNLISYKLMEAHLGRRNLDIIHANDGLEALHIFKSDPDIDLIIMDVQLPGMTGIEVTRLIRELNGDIPIIAATANAFEDDKEACYSVGCTNYLTKPIDFPALFELLEKYLA